MRTKVQEFFDNLSEIEQQAIGEIMNVENDSKRLNQITSKTAEEKIKNIIEKYCFIRRES
ncbi:MAG: hypothetical protein RR904_02910 [Bacilli bacterium]